MEIDGIVEDMLNISQAVLPQIAQERLDRIQTRTASIGVVGLGYVGLPISVIFSDAGYKVTGFDINTRNVTDLEAGCSYIFRIPSTEIQIARLHGFSATSDFTRLAEQDAIIMCVPTPLNKHHERDLSYVENMAKSAAPWIREGQLVVIDSSTYPGTNEELMIPLLEAGNRQGLKVQSIGLPTRHGVFFRYVLSREREFQQYYRDTARYSDVVNGHKAVATELGAILN
jgi:UDP-N-acetyl-D-glucosamine dehydrogenase